MRKDADLERRLAHVAALHALKATAGRARLAHVRVARGEAEAGLAAGDSALEASRRALDALAASDVLDFDGWRIGCALVGDLGAARDAAADEVSRRRADETAAQVAVGQDRARQDRAEALHRTLARSLGDKRDDAASLEASALATLRKLMARP